MGDAVDDPAPSPGRAGGADDDGPEWDLPADAAGGPIRVALASSPQQPIVLRVSLAGPPPAAVGRLTVCEAGRALATADSKGPLASVLGRAIHLHPGDWVVQLEVRATGPGVPPHAWQVPLSLVRADPEAFRAPATAPEPAADAVATISPTRPSAAAAVPRLATADGVRAINPSVPAATATPAAGWVSAGAGHVFRLAEPLRPEPTGAGGGAAPPSAVGAAEGAAGDDAAGDDAAGWSQWRLPVSDRGYTLVVRVRPLDGPGAGGDVACRIDDAGNPGAAGRARLEVRGAGPLPVASGLVCRWAGRPIRAAAGPDGMAWLTVTVDGDSREVPIVLTPAGRHVAP